MPEKLKREQASSSVANVLNLQLARAAVDRPGTHPPRSTAPAETPQPAADERGIPAPEPPRPTNEPSGEVPSVVRQFQLTPSTDATLRRVMSVYSGATGLELNRSEFFRSLLRALEHTLPLHEREAPLVGTLKRPKNEPWLFHKRDELETRLARALVAAMRAAAPME
jgi:hypothetical protein